MKLEHLLKQKQQLETKLSELDKLIRAQVKIPLKHTKISIYYDNQAWCRDNPILSRLNEDHLAHEILRNLEYMFAIEKYSLFDIYVSVSNNYKSINPLTKGCGYMSIQCDDPTFNLAPIRKEAKTIIARVQKFWIDVQKSEKQFTQGII